MQPLLPVVTASESAGCDAAAVAAGIPSRALMQRAGAAAAGEIALRYRDDLSAGVAVLTGPGNNGGDGWVVARALGAAGVRVRVLEAADASAPDARAERDLAVASLGAAAVVRFDGTPPPERIIVDALLGTGATGGPRGVIGDAVRCVRASRERGAVVVAIDLPTGVDASSGAAAGDAVAADLTLTFATIKRGHLVARGACGTIAVLDIGLGAQLPRSDAAPRLVDERWVAARVPPIPATAHKGIRKKLAIVGGASGMAGAAMLGARAALRSGIGMVKLIVAPASLPMVQEGEPYALAAAWPADEGGVDEAIGRWADAVAIGPGLGRSDESRALLERVLRVWRGPTLLDADAITLFEGRVDALGAVLAGRPALLTPHPVEFARLSGVAAADVLANPYDAGLDVAARLGAALLLKGVPTVVSSRDGRRLVSASGTPALATAGSGDVLTGIAATMLAQIGDPCVAGAIGAWVHGRAAERVGTPAATVRGIALEDVVAELRECWDFDERPARYPVLAELAAAAAP